MPTKNSELSQTEQVKQLVKRMRSGTGATAVKQMARKHPELRKLIAHEYVIVADISKRSVAARKRVEAFAKDNYPNPEVGLKTLTAALAAVNQNDLTAALQFKNKNVLLHLGPGFLDPKGVFPSIENQSVPGDIFHLDVLRAEIAVFEKRLALAGLKVPSYEDLVKENLSTSVKNRYYDPKKINVTPLRDRKGKFFFTVQFPVVSEAGVAGTRTALYDPYNPAVMGVKKGGDVASLQASEKFTIRSCVETADEVDNSSPLEINLCLLGEVDMSKAMEAPKKSKSAPSISI